MLGVLLAFLALANTSTKTLHLHVNGAHSCSKTSGNLSLVVATPPNVAAIAPFTAFFDASGTTDSSITGNTTPQQDITYTWDFGDAGASGTGTWANGSNPGGNSRNTATGPVAAHLYGLADGSGDQNYTVTVHAYYGADSASCSLTVTAYDPAGSNGFPGTATACVAASSTPTAGGGGCPAGAAVLNQSNFGTALTSKLTNGKRVLFKCGDTFTGDNSQASVVKGSIGAYGGCQGTKISRPIFSSSGPNDEMDISGTSGDLRVADIDFQGNGTANGAIGEPQDDFLKIGYRITLYNLNASGTSGAFSWAQGAQWAIVDSSAQNMLGHIEIFGNYSENNPPYSGNTINNLNFTALLGNYFNGTGNTATGGGQEVVRLSACRYCSIENNTILNANSLGGVFKLHQGNTYASCGSGFTGPPCPAFPCPVTGSVNANCWRIGTYTELVEISDNDFDGTSGGVLVDIAPQSSAREEHLRNIIFERNIVAGITANWGSPGQLRAAVVNFTVRNNAFRDLGQGVHAYAQYMLNIGQLGIEPVATGFEVYNNTCHMPNPQDNSQSCFAFNGVSMNAPPQNGDVEGNLFYAASGTHTMIVSTGTSITIANNSGNSAGSPAFINAGGSFLLMSDFKPTANYTGGASLPGVKYDALGVTRTSTDLGAVQH